jgi:hypothetical protein
VTLKEAMIDSLDTGALLSRTYELPAGPRVRLRYARRSDVPGLRALLQQRGIEPTELELNRLVRYDGLADLLASALVGRARAHARRVA